MSDPRPPIPTVLAAMAGVAHRDLRLAMRRRSDSAAVLFFFLLVTSLFPLGVGPEPELLRRMAPGIVWVAALLASMLSLARMFSSDYEDGTLEQLVICAYPLPLLAVGKIAAHWLCSGLPLALLAPLIALQFDLGGYPMLILFGALLLGTPLLSLIGAVGAALTVGVRGGGILLSLLVLPLYIPVLIFGAGAVDAAGAGLPVQGHFSILAAVLVLGCFLAPLATATALRISVE